jgi:preprotein translocase subunit SecB
VDETREPGIRLASIVIEHLHFDDIRAGDRPPNDHLYMLSIERRSTEQPNIGDAVLHFAMKPKDDEASTFQLTVDVVGRFEADPSNPNLGLETFLKVNGPALLVPFLREMVANITFRSRHGVVLLPAINVVALVQREDGAPKQ